MGSIFYSGMIFGLYLCEVHSHNINLFLCDSVLFHNDYIGCSETPCLDWAAQQSSMSMYTLDTDMLRLHAHI